MSSPSPLTGPSVDLRDFAFMPLDVVRLRDSDIGARVTGEEFRAAVFLWCAAWHQVPAASLPDDDVVLSNLSGFGRNLNAWKKVKGGALHGWVRCSDGRLYHPTVAEKANEAWQSKLRHAWEKACDRIRKENKKRAEKGLDPLVTLSFDDWLIRENSDGKDEEFRRNAAGFPAENALKGQGQGKGEKEDRSKSPLSEPPAPDPRLQRFPDVGTIDYGPWAEISRECAPGMDPDGVAQAFRELARSVGFDLDAKNIVARFEGFARKHHALNRRRA